MDSGKISVNRLLKRVLVWMFLVTPAAGAQAGVHLPLDEGQGVVASDIDGTVDSALLVGDPVYDTDTPSGLGYSLRFDGDDDLIDLGFLEAGEAGITLAAWVKADTFPGNPRDPRVISKADGIFANDHVFLLSTIAVQSNTRPVFRLKINGATRTVRGGSASNLATGQWYHLAATYDGSVMRLFLDGVQVGSRNISGTIDLDPSVAVSVGSQPNGTKNWNGLIDDVRILQSTTALNDIQALMVSTPAVVAVDDEFTTDEESTLSVASPGLLANDSIEGGGALTVDIISSTTDGTLSADGSGAFTYTPNVDFSGVDNFVYTATDDSGGSSTAVVTINVLAVNDAPVSVGESYVFTPGTTSVVESPGVLANDSDVDGDVITSILVTSSASGSVTFESNGRFEYTPDAGFSGNDFIEYQAVDTAEARSQLTRVDIVVLPPTLAIDDELAGAEDEIIELPQPGVLLNDTASTIAENLVASVVQEPEHGELSLQQNGALSYEPELNFFGADSFVYEALDTETGLAATASVVISISPVNDIPVVEDDTYQYTQVPDDPQAPLTVGAPGVLANDYDVESDTLTAELVSAAENGVLSLDASGGFSYTPNANFTGTDTFTYLVSDGTGVSVNAAVTIDVPPEDLPPLAATDSFTALPSQTLIIEAPGVLANDNDSESSVLMAELVSSTMHGDLILAENGRVEYVADSDFGGEDFFEYRAIDSIGQRSSVTRVNIMVIDAPQAIDDAYAVVEDAELSVSAPGVLGNDSATETMRASLLETTANGSLSLEVDGAFVYTANADYFGTDSFSYEAFDTASGLTLSATVLITVSSVNDAPVASSVSFVTTFETALSGSVAGNVSDVDGDVLEVTVSESTSSGTLQLEPGGAFIYIPNAGFSGVDTFTYNASDQVAVSNDATVTITVAADPGTGNPVNSDLLVKLVMDDEQFPVTDSSGYGNHGAVSGPLFYSTETADNSFRSLQFNGQNTSVNLGSIDVDGSGLTMAAWFNASSFPGNSRDPRIISKATGAASQDHFFMLGMTLSNGETRLRARVRANGQTATLVAPPGFEILEGQWYHAAATYDGAFVRLYLNATEIASTALTGTLDKDPSVNVSVGSQPDGSKPFDGLIDGVHLLQRSLSVPELADLAGVELAPVAGSGVYDSDFEVTYKEYWISHEWFTGLDDCADSPVGGKFFIEPHGEESACPMYFDIPDDISGALRAEVYMDIWRGRDTRSVRFNLNGNETRRPTVGSDWSRTPYVGEIPLSEISQGTNVLNLWRGGGQFHVHDIAVRVYHNDDNPLIENGAPVVVPQANLVSIADDNVINDTLGIPGVLDIDGDKLTLTAYASRDAKFIEFHAYYDGYDEDNDGKSLDWHNRTRNNWHPGGRSPQGTGGTIDHIGSVLVGQAGEYSVDWDIPWLTAQSNVRFKVRVVDGDGNVRDAAGGATAEFELVRRTTRVDRFSIPDFEDFVLWAGGNEPASLSSVINLPVDPSAYDEALLVASYWNNPNLSINGNPSFSAFNGTDDWQLSIRNFPVDYLVAGDNQLLYEHDSGYGEFIESPGPMIVLRGTAPTGPAATGDLYTVVEDTVLDIASPGVLVNDIDPEGDVLTAVLVTPSANGTVGLSSTGAFLYTPDPDFVGTDAFTYVASDGDSMSGAVTVTITVTAGNDAPIAIADSYDIAPNVIFILDAPGVLGNDADPDSDAVTAELVSDVAYGSITQSPDGALEYTPDSGFSGVDSFAYQAVDSFGLRSAVTLVEFVVSPLPVANDDVFTISEDGTLDIAAPGILANDTDTVDADNLTVSVLQQAVNGTVRLEANGALLYTPLADFFGSDEFTYEATDPDTGLSAMAAVSVNVTPVNDAPVANADSFTTPFERLLEASVIANDSDADFDQLTASLVQEAGSGTVQMNIDGSFNYLPDSSFEGQDSFTYILSDAETTSNEATVTISVSAQGSIADPDLLVKLAMDEGSFPVTDSSGYGNDGIPVGPLVYSADVANESLYSLEFNGVDTSVNLGSLDANGTGLTMGAWFNARSFPGSARDPRIISKATGSATNDHTFMLGTIRSGSKARLRSRVRIGSTTVTLVAPNSSALDTDRWYHAATTYDGAVLRLYLDGEEIATRTIAGTIATDPAVDVAVGSQPDGSKVFDGLLDDVQLLQRAMTPQEVAYAAGDDTVFLPVIPTVPSELRSIALANNRTDLAWVASLDNTGVDFYEIYRDGLLLGTTDVTEWMDVTDGLVGTVVYTVVAVDIDGNRSTEASVLASIPSSTEGPWWDANWPYRIQIGVDTGAWARQERVVNIAADFDQLIVNAGGTAAFNHETMRCHEVDRDGSILVSDVYCQAPAADVVSIWMSGTTPVNTTRYYHVYFDEFGGLSSESGLPPLVETTTGVTDENQMAVQIDTPTATLLYQLDAAGFSSLLDADGMDWVGFNEDNVGINGTFRGIPNLVPPANGGYFHPGVDTAITTIDEQGPIRTRLVSETTDGLWKLNWEITPNAATLTVERNASNYWFLYEGTPGGVLDSADSTYRSIGLSSELPALSSWQGDLIGDEWVVVTGSENGRALYFAHHQNDAVEDSYRPASVTQGGMTILGFGRTNNTANFENAGETFSMGFLVDQNFANAKAQIESQIKPVAAAHSSPVTTP